jgi:hypothetical protein
MSTTRVIHVHEMPDYPDAVYVGRAIPRKGLKRHPLANPVRVGTGPTDETRAVSLAMYRRRLPFFLQDGHVEALIALRGKPLACWCHRSDDPRTEDNACHADIIAEWLEQYTDDDLRNMARAKAA